MFSEELVSTKKDKISKRLLKGIFDTDLHDEEDIHVNDYVKTEKDKLQL
jgi:hypothetical protein